MKNKVFIGIDVSKLMLDVFILNKQFHFSVENNPSGYISLPITFLAGTIDV